jgi:hypothetical protein
MELLASPISYLQISNDLKEAGKLAGHKVSQLQILDAS